jgi:hypothetical protein
MSFGRLLAFGDSVLKQRQNDHAQGRGVGTAVAVSRRESCYGRRWRLVPTRRSRFGTAGSAADCDALSALTLSDPLGYGFDDRLRTVSVRRVTAMCQLAKLDIWSRPCNAVDLLH